MPFACSSALRWTALVVVLAASSIAVAQPEADRQSHSAADDHEADHPAAASEPNPLAVHLDLAVWTGVVFVLLFLVLSKFAWPQISAALEQREKKIADHIAAAEEKHEEAKRLLREYEAKIALAAGEVRELLDEARRDAEATKSRIAAEARQVAEDEKGRALREIERAKDGAVQELAQTSAGVAIELARKVVREDLTPDRQGQIVREALSMMSAAGASRN